MKKSEKIELERDRKVIDECLGKIPLIDPNAKTYRKYLFVPIAFYIIYLLFLFIVFANNGTMTKACLASSPICLLGTTSIYYEPLLAIIIFGGAILLLLNIAGLLYEPLVYIALFPETIMMMFLAFINVELVLLFIVIVVPKFLYLYYDKKDKNLIIEKI